MLASVEQCGIPACVADEVYDLLVRVCGCRNDRELFRARVCGCSAATETIPLICALGRSGRLVVRAAQPGRYRLRVDYAREEITPQRDAMWSRVMEGLRRIERRHAAALGLQL